MLDRVKRLLGTLVVASALCLPVLGAEFDPNGGDQIRPLTPPAEQRIEVLTPPGEQTVEAISPEEAQRVTEGTKSPSGRTANAVAKVFIGVAAAGISLAAMAASLLFL